MPVIQNGYGTSKVEIIKFRPECQSYKTLAEPSLIVWRFGRKPLFPALRTKLDVWRFGSAHLSGYQQLQKN